MNDFYKSLLPSSSKGHKILASMLTTKTILKESHSKIVVHKSLRGNRTWYLPKYGQLRVLPNTIWFRGREYYITSDGDYVRAELLYPINYERSVSELTIEDSKKVQELRLLSNYSDSGIVFKSWKWVDFEKIDSLKNKPYYFTILRDKYEGTRKTLNILTEDGLILIIDKK